MLPHPTTDRTSGNNSVILDVMADMAHAHNEAASDDGKGKGECDAATGKRKVCVKKYETECRTRYVKQMMMEDQPRSVDYIPMSKTFKFGLQFLQFNI